MFPSRESCGLSTVRADAIQSDPPPVYASHAAPVPAVIYVGLYQFAVPRGQSAAMRIFGRMLRRARGTVRPMKLLDKNGFASGIGVSSLTDWGKFKSILDKAGAGQTGNSLPQEFIGTSVNNEEFARSAEMPSQELFYYDSHGLSGRFTTVHELFRAQFRSLAGEGRLGAIGVMPGGSRRSAAIGLHVLNDRDEIDYKTDEHIYDLNLRIDLRRANA